MNKITADQTSGSGQSLFEIIITLAVATIIIVGVVALATKTVGNTTASNDSSQAARYSEQISECLRQERDLDWDTFAATIQSGPSTCQSITSGIFSQSITLTSISATEINAQVIVSWTDGSGSHEVNSLTTFTDWRRN